MDTSRLILLICLAVVSMMLMQKWEEDYGQPQQFVENETSSSISVKQASDLPETPSLSSSSSADESSLIADHKTAKTAGTVSVETDVFSIQISLQGGGIDQAKFKQYPLHHDNPDEPLTFFDRSHHLFYVFQGGLLSNTQSPTHDSVYQSEQQRYQIREGEDVLVVPLVWTSETGLRIEKRYVFRRNSYLVGVEYQIQNSSDSSWAGRAYGQLQRDNPDNGQGLIRTYTGAVFSTPEKRYEKISFDDMEESVLKEEVVSGWVAMLQHYFVSALVPDNNEQTYYFYTKALPEQSHYLIGAMTPVTEIVSGESGTLKHKIYFGPKTQKRLENIAPGLDLTVDYGVLWFIAKPLFVCMDWFHTHTGNWGWSIILVTFLIKLLFYPLSAAGYRSMANMRRVQPRLLNIRERYKNDKSRLNQAMMELYKEEKINPLGGCFPILVQIPVFLALYWVLLESVELRQASFVLWLQDLSSPDPWFILPVVMGVTMFIQQKLNPAPMDPVQEKIMSFLPIAFTVFFAFFPSGLVLYWVVNNILSIAQQARINHTLAKAGLK